MQNQFLIEELQRLQQQRQQQELLQQLQLGSLSTAVGPSASSLLGSLSSLGGSGTTATSSVDALLIRELLQQQLRNSTAAAAASPLASLLGHSTAVNLQPASDPGGDLIRALAASGLLGNQPAPTVAVNEPAQTPAANQSNLSAVVNVNVNAALPGLVETLRTNNDRKRPADPVASIQQQQDVVQAPEERNPKKQRTQDTASERDASPVYAPSVQYIHAAPGGLNALLSAVAAHQKYSDEAEAKSKAAMRGRGFPLPPLDEKDAGKPCRPKLTGFKSAWGKIKSKEMQKEIFLRKLHQGKLVRSSLHR